MRYIIAFDGGGTKSHYCIFDLTGKLVYNKIVGGSNHQSLGINHTKTVLSKLFEESLQDLDLFPDQIAFAYLGISGADLESDYVKLNDICEDVFHDIPFKVVNDAWLVLRSGLKTPYGAVAISGTGTNSAAINRQGQRAILRSLGFTLGIYGGGLDIAREGLHYAFRADELTGENTILQQKIPQLLGVGEMNDVVDLFYPTMKIDRIKFGEITKLVFECAESNDKISISILERIGNILGLQTGGVIRQLNMQTEEVPVVIGGSVFQNESRILVSAFTNCIHKVCPKAEVIKPKYKPVVGAFLFGLDELQLNQSEFVEQNLEESGLSYGQRN